MERERRRRQVERRRARRRLTGALTRPLSRRRRRRRPDSALARQQRRQNGMLLGFLLVLHVVLWLVSDSWLWRLSALILTLMAWPVLVTVLFDRRTRP